MNRGIEPEIGRWIQDHHYSKMTKPPAVIERGVFWSLALLAIHTGDWRAFDHSGLPGSLKERHLLSSCRVRQGK